MEARVNKGNLQKCVYIYSTQSDSNGNTIYAIAYRIPLSQVNTTNQNTILQTIAIAIINNIAIIKLIIMNFIPTPMHDGQVEIVQQSEGDKDVLLILYRVNRSTEGRTGVKGCLSIAAVNVEGEQDKGKKGETMQGWQ